MSSTEFRIARDVLIELRDDYDGARKRFRWPEIGTFNWAIDWFDDYLASAAETADRVALQIVGSDAVTLTFRELSERSSRVANALRALGVRRGDHVLLMLGNCGALWETMLALMKLGAVTIPATTLLTSDDLAARIKQGRVSFWITSVALAEKLDRPELEVVRISTGGVREGWIEYERFLDFPSRFEAEEPTRADDRMLLYFTSGTTSQPKLVTHTHRSYPVGSLSTMYWLGLRTGDVHLNVSSPGWAKHAWSCFFAPWNAGATVFVLNQGRFDARGLLDAFVKNRITSFCAPPTVWRMLIQEDLASFKTTLTSVCSAGEPLNPEVIDTVQRAWGLTIRDGFGQTETTAQIANSPGQRVRAGSMGRPMPGYDVVLLNADGREVAEGEICLRLSPRPAGLTCGYQNPDGTLTPVQGDIYRTGDVATRDADGWFTYLGRADDVFKASDYRISPFELESALIEHAMVAEAAVVPAPDSMRLAVPKAFIVLASQITPSPMVALEIFKHIKSALAPYKRIRRIEFSDLPKTISGKIRRVELRRLEVERANSGIRGEGEYWEDDFPELRSK